MQSSRSAERRRTASAESSSGRVRMPGSCNALVKLNNLTIWLENKEPEDNPLYSDQKLEKFLPPKVVLYRCLLTKTDNSFYYFDAVGWAVGRASGL